MSANGQQLATVTAVPSQNFTPWRRMPAQPVDRLLPIFCIPHAGGVASSFTPWTDAYRDQGIEFIPIELPGHGRRKREPLQKNMYRIVHDILTVLGDRIDEPFAILGHSLGALIGYELTRQLQQRRKPLPVLLIVSGSATPDAVRGPGRPELSEEMLSTQLTAFPGGLSETVARSHYAQQLMLPVLRNDLQLLLKYRRTVSLEVLDCPILALGGDLDDFVRPQQPVEWKSLTSSHFDYQEIPGDHFFLYADPDRSVTRIRQQLTRIGMA